MSRPLKLLALTMLAGALLCAPAQALRPGALDKSFGGDGVITVAASKEGVLEANALVVQPGGLAVVAAGGRLIRYLPNGRRDPAFRQRSVPALDLARGPGETLTRVGHHTVERLLANGRPDRSFGSGDGRVRLPDVDLSTLEVGADADTIVAGAAQGRVAVARLLPDGALDPSFDSDGIVLTQVTEEPFQPTVDRADSVALMADGRIVVGASIGEQDPPNCLKCWGPYLAAAVVRYLPDGSLDPSFGSGGIYRAEGERWGGAESVLVRPNGGVAFAAGAATGVTPIGNEAGFTVVELTAGGLLDPGFAEGGINRLYLPHDPESTDPAAAVLAALPGGRILAAGGWSLPAVMMTERLGSDGRRIPFGGHLFVRKQVAGPRVSGPGATALALAPHHRFYVLGTAQGRAVLARFGY